MAESTIAADAHVRKHLEQINLHLHLVHSGIIIAAEALHYQNSGRDSDVACVLINCVGERLAIQMDRIDELVGELITNEPSLSDSDSDGCSLKGC